jgi:hypothetical protein
LEFSSARWRHCLVARSLGPISTSTVSLQSYPDADALSAFRLVRPRARLRFEFLPFDEGRVV